MKVVSKHDFKREVESFKDFGVSNPGMVRYFANYIQMQPNPLEGDPAYSWSILLELCDGDLDDWMETEPAPILPQDIFDFWSGLFQVALGLEELHDSKHPDDDGDYWQG
jgi:hypothetical protein